MAVSFEGAAFKAAWRSCTNDTAVKHLDVDAPLLMDGLAAQDVSGLWSVKTIQCSTGTAHTFLVVLFSEQMYHGLHHVMVRRSKATELGLSSGTFRPGDYQGWLAWRRGLPDVARV